MSEKAKSLAGILSGFDLSKADKANLPKPDKKDPDNDPVDDYFERQAQKVPPTLKLNNVQVPFIENWTVGNTYTLVIKAKLTEMETEEDEGKKRVYATLTLSQLAGM